MQFDIEPLVSSVDLEGAAVVFREVTPPQAGPPLHSHHYQSEIFHVISGRYLFVVDGHETEAGPGECLHVPPGSVHAFRNLLDEPSVLHFELLPAGKSEEFFERLVDGNFDPDQMEAFFEEFDMELLGPPLQ